MAAARIALALALLLCATAADAQTERILDFLSDVELQPDSRLEVTETIRFRVLGTQIRHGINRDFPTDYPGPRGSRSTTGFVSGGRLPRLRRRPDAAVAIGERGAHPHRRPQPARPARRPHLHHPLPDVVAGEFRAGRGRPRLERHRKWLELADRSRGIAPARAALASEYGAFAAPPAIPIDLGVMGALVVATAALARGRWAIAVIGLPLLSLGVIRRLPERPLVPRRPVPRRHGGPRQRELLLPADGADDRRLEAPQRDRGSQVLPWRRGGRSAARVEPGAL